MITLATLEQATAQEVFDQVATHLLTQKKRSVKHNGSLPCCSYRGEDGTKCAAGCLISDKEFEWMNPNWNNYPWITLVNNLFIPTDKHLELIQDLQSIHDTVPVDSWKDELKNVASVYDLSDGILENFQ